MDAKLAVICLLYSKILSLFSKTLLYGKEMSSRIQVGELARQTRKAGGQTQKYWTGVTGIHPSTLSQIENARFYGSLDILERYLDALGLELIAQPKQQRFPDWDEIEEMFRDEP